MGQDGGINLNTTTALDKALHELAHDFSQLAGWEPFGYLGGPLPGEKSISPIPVYFTGRMHNGIRLLASHPDLPYEGNPSKLVQHAAFLLCAHLAQVMAEKGDDYKELLDTLRYDKAVARAQERQRKEASFRSILAAKEEELQDALRPPVAPTENLADVVLELKFLALTASGRLRAKLSRLVLRNKTVQDAVREIRFHTGTDWETEHIVPWAEDVFSDVEKGE